MRNDMKERGESCNNPVLPWTCEARHGKSGASLLGLNSIFSLVTFHL
jgi:hypothetical protein